MCKNISVFISIYTHPPSGFLQVEFGQRSELRVTTLHHIKGWETSRHTVWFFFNERVETYRTRILEKSENGLDFTLPKLTLTVLTLHWLETVGSKSPNVLIEWKRNNYIYLSYSVNFFMYNKVIFQTINTSGDKR